jgi:hypothetical protein
MFDVAALHTSRSAATANTATFDVVSLDDANSAEADY